MNWRPYISRYIFLVIVYVGIYLFFYQYPHIKPHLALTVIYFIGLSLLSMLHFVFSEAMKSRKKKMILFNLSVSLMILKLILTATLSLVYLKASHPPTNIFIVPIIAIYISFTIFEAIYSLVQVKS